MGDKSSIKFEKLDYYFGHESHLQMALRGMYECVNDREKVERIVKITLDEFENENTGKSEY